MELYFKNNLNDITYPDRSNTLKNSIGIPKNNPKSFYIRDKSELIPTNVQKFYSNPTRIGLPNPYKGRA